MPRQGADRARVADDARGRDPHGRHDRRRRDGAEPATWTSSTSTPPYDELLHVIIAHRPFALSGVRGRRENVIGILMAKDLLKLQRSPDLQPAHAAAPGGLRARIEGAERPAARLPLEPQPPRHRHRRVRQHRRACSRSRTCSRRSSARSRTSSTRRTARSSIYTLADGSQRVAGDATVVAVNEAFGVDPADRRVRHHRRPGRARARPRAAARRGA